MAQTDVAGGLEYDSDQSDDFESTETSSLAAGDAFDNVQASKCYWLGKHFMRFAQAYAVLSESGPGEDVTESDVKLEERVREFPYTSSLRSLQECDGVLLPPLLRNNTRDDYEAFLCAMGHMLVSGDNLESEMCMLVRGLQHRGDNAVNHWPETLKTKDFAHRQKKVEKPIKTRPENYYNVLRQYAQEMREVVQRTSDVKPCGSCIVTLTLTGREFIGKDTEIKEALGKAAKKGCEAFGLEVS